ncbi:CDP-diacylglycerol--glycerol-3-phosphate 3-phosphatidyltransferase [Schaalia hyovaginalis]|uniref:CDP-diacylglycerol--glycerol-3-phosphate 3-phosphatidyltransferase n=1 Tax=Schaalia hyovaginalis TaxID=29316 RepID=A0A923IWT5_9ACTO|nr:CDP-diacylglycerol--glycerol-3-phosphate 3-phosphatidyltransferase [Schaalia hyovaginalis]MBB6334417.1 CDP-diacylglycerol--glycerol-3-phosphate 3-phosphatidyltransferase [Schaalia hyovaginalis]MDY2668738.1 CDP-diacylglycerol--glycerol-3-phosphate 3-phosphatidyltransferase [Schaalia hyovaginalis]
MDDNVSRVDRERRVSPLNLPNALTVLRLILVPVFILLLVSGAHSARWWALAVFMVAAYTDHLDGRIARARGLVTDFGKIVDPIADKALTLGAFIMLSIAHPWLWLVTVPVAIRELGITWWRADLLKRGVVVAANKGGKLKTVLQILAIWLLLIPWDLIGASEFPLGLVAKIGFALGYAAAVLALIVTLWSGWVYIAEGRRLQKSAESQS